MEKEFKNPQLITYGNKTWEVISQTTNYYFLVDPSDSDNRKTLSKMEYQAYIQTK